MSCSYLPSLPSGARAKLSALTPTSMSCQDSPTSLHKLHMAGGPLRGRTPACLPSGRTRSTTRRNTELETETVSPEDGERCGSRESQPRIPPPPQCSSGAAAICTLLFSVDADTPRVANSGRRGTARTVLSGGGCYAHAGHASVLGREGRKYTIYFQRGLCRIPIHYLDCLRSIWLCLHV